MQSRPSGRLFRHPAVTNRLGKQQKIRILVLLFPRTAHFPRFLWMYVRLQMRLRSPVHP